MAADGGGVLGGGDVGRVRGVGEGGRWRRSKHDEVGRATDAAGIGGVDCELDVWQEGGPGGSGLGDEAAAEEGLDGAVKAFHLAIGVTGVGAGAVVVNVIGGAKVVDEAAEFTAAVGANGVGVAEDASNAVMEGRGDGGAGLIGKDG